MEAENLGATSAELEASPKAEEDRKPEQNMFSQHMKGLRFTSLPQFLVRPAKNIWPTKCKTLFVWTTGHVALAAQAGFRAIPAAHFPCLLKFIYSTLVFCLLSQMSLGTLHQLSEVDTGIQTSNKVLH